MADLSRITRSFVSAHTANAEEAFLRAFREGVEEACDEYNDDEVDEELDCSDWEDFLADVSEERNRLMGFYLPAILRAGGELSAIVGGYRSQLLRLRIELIQRGIGSLDSSDSELAALSPTYAALLTRFTDAYEQKNKEIERRMKQMLDGLVWSAAELGYGAAAGRVGRVIYWNMDPAAEHCETCVTLEGGSPYESVAHIGGVPGSDITKCKSKCRCYLTFGPG